MPRLFILAFLVIWMAAPSVHAESIAVTDSTGEAVDSLESLEWGDARLVSLDALAVIAGWTSNDYDSSLVMHAGGHLISLKKGNRFAQVDGHFFQLRHEVREWDGAWWVPVVNLTELLPDLMRVEETTGTLRLLRHRKASSAVIPETPAVETPVAEWRLRTIIIDPGHGGKDPGTTTAKGLPEKGIVLDIALRLAGELRAQGLRVVLTRETDRFLTLGARTRKANEEQGDLFLSIHCNSHRDPGIHGIETYFLKPAKSERAVEVALKENSVVQLEEDTTGYSELNEANYILQSMAISQFMRESEIWAADAVGQTAITTGMKSRGVDQAGFYVLMGASMPAVLVECGYLSNEHDVKILASEGGRQKIAQALSRSILNMKLKLENSASK